MVNPLWDVAGWALTVAFNMAHLAIQAAQDGEVVTGLEQVSDEHYQL